MSLPYDVTILLIDQGGKRTVKSTFIRELPDEYKQLHIVATDLRISDLVPIDSDKLFDRATTIDVTNEIIRTIQSDNYMICTIELAIQNTLFAQNFQVIGSEKKSGSPELFNLEQYLQLNQLAVFKEKIFYRILKSAYEAGLFKLKEPETESLQEQEEEGIEENEPDYSPGNLSLEMIAASEHVSISHSTPIRSVKNVPTCENPTAQNDNNNPFLCEDFKLPVEWSQNSVMITMQLHAAGVTDYALFFDDHCINITFKFLRGYATSCFSFFMLIDSDYVSFEMRDDVLSVYIMKINTGEVWLQLSNGNDEKLFITSNSKLNRNISTPSVAYGYMPCGSEQSELQEGEDDFQAEDHRPAVFSNESVPIEREQVNCRLIDTPSSDESEVKGVLFEAEEEEDCQYEDYYLPAGFSDDEDNYF
jgi:hypothetical protein